MSIFDRLNSGGVSFGTRLQALGAGFQGGNPMAVLNQARDAYERDQRKAQIAGLMEQMGIGQPKMDILSTLPLEAQQQYVLSQMTPARSDPVVMGDRLVDKSTGSVIADFSPRQMSNNDFLSALGGGPAPKVDLSAYAVGGAAARPDSFSGLNTEFHDRVGAMVQAAAADGIDLKITSAYRSPELQAQLWQAALEKYGDPEIADNWVARPGMSKHNEGLAVDFAGKNGGLLRDANSPEAQWIKANAARFGLDVPLSNEPWQVEMGGARGQPMSATPVSSGLSQKGRAALEGLLLNPNLTKEQREYVTRRLERLEPGFRPASPEEAARYGAAGGQFGPDGRFYPINQPSGTSVEIGPDGTMIFNQGAGVGRAGSLPTDQSRLGRDISKGDASLLNEAQEQAAAADNLNVNIQAARRALLVGEDGDGARTGAGEGIAATLSRWSSVVGIGDGTRAAEFDELDRISKAIGIDTLRAMGGNDTERELLTAIQTTISPTKLPQSNMRIIANQMAASDVIANKPAVMEAWLKQYGSLSSSNDNGQTFADYWRRYQRDEYTQRAKRYADEMGLNQPAEPPSQASGGRNNVRATNPYASLSDDEFKSLDILSLTPEEKQLLLEAMGQ